MGTEKGKTTNGVALMAAAIRAEMAERASQSSIATPNVSDVTAQFATGKSQVTDTPDDSTAAFNKPADAAPTPQATPQGIETTNNNESN